MNMLTPAELKMNGQLVIDELQELARKIEVTQELLTDYCSKGIVNMQVKTMERLIEAHREVQKAEREYEEYIGQIGREGE